MKFIFADSMDMVDPEFDFTRDRSSPSREPYWDDAYTHQILGYAPYDGLLVSKAVVGGHVKSGKYSEGQAMRFKREGARKFLRFEEKDYPNTVMWGDCGAFAYVNEENPPYSVDDIIEFYADGQFTHGCSVDHIIFQFQDNDFDLTFDDKEVRRRQEITLSNAAEFITKSRTRIGNHFTPVGVVHGWSPASMANAASEMVKMGYNYLALGGMVPLRANQIKSALLSVRDAIPSSTQIHILGFAKADNIHEFEGIGLNSIDTTSPLLRAFKDSRSNYYTLNDGEMEYYTAIRVPQTLDSTPLKKLVQSGKLELETSVKCEKEALRELRLLDEGTSTMENALDAIRTYWALIKSEDAKTNPIKANKEMATLTSRVIPTLKNMPWKECTCKICRDIGVEVVIFRGNNRNRRRGMHNLAVYADKIQTLRSEI